MWEWMSFSFVTRSSRRCVHYSGAFIHVMLNVPCQGTTSTLNEEGFPTIVRVRYCHATCVKGKTLLRKLYPVNSLDLMYVIRPPSWLYGSEPVSNRHSPIHTHCTSLLMPFSPLQNGCFLNARRRYLVQLRWPFSLNKILEAIDNLNREAHAWVYVYALLTFVASLVKVRACSHLILVAISSWGRGSRDSA